MEASQVRRIEVGAEEVMVSAMIYVCTRHYFITF